MPFREAPPTPSTTTAIPRAGTAPTTSNNTAPSAEPSPFAHVLVQPIEKHEYIQLPALDQNKLLNAAASNSGPRTDPNYTEHEHSIELPSCHTIVSYGSQRIHDFDSIPDEELVRRFDRVITVTRGIARHRIRIDIGFSMGLPGSGTELEHFETSATVELPVDLLPVSEEQRLGIRVDDDNDDRSSKRVERYGRGGCEGGGVQGDKVRRVHKRARSASAGIRKTHKDARSDQIKQMRAGSRAMFVSEDSDTVDE